MTPERTVVLQRIVRSRIDARQWRDATEREVRDFARRERSDKATVARLLAEVRRQYDEAGAGFSGRWQ